MDKLNYAKLFITKLFTPKLNQLILIMVKLSQTKLIMVKINQTILIMNNLIIVKLNYFKLN